jgi:hypothetical protein
MRLSARPTERAILLVLGLLAVGLICYATYKVLVKPRGNAFDFYTIWYAGRVFWAGGNPYSLETAHAIQQAVFGHIVETSANQQGFAYPAYLLVLLWPLILLPFPAAVSLWTTLQFIGIVATVVLTVVALRWKPTPLVFGLIVFAALFYRYTMINYVLGQTVIVVALSVTASICLYQRGHHVAAGLVLIYAAVRPDIGGILGIAVCVYALLEGNPRVLLSWAGGLTLLAVIALVRRPTWPLDFIEGIRLYAGYAPVTWPAGLLPPAGAVAALLTVAICYYVMRLSFQQPSRLPVLLAALIPILLLLLPQTGSYTLTLALIPLLVAVRPGPSPAARWVAFLVLIAAWMLHYLSTEHVIPTAVDQIWIPLHTALALGLSTLHPNRSLN